MFTRSYSPQLYKELSVIRVNRKTSSCGTKSAILLIKCVFPLPELPCTIACKGLLVLYELAMINSNNRLFASPTIPLCSISLLISCSRLFCFKISMVFSKMGCFGLGSGVTFCFIGSSIIVLVSSIENKKGISFLWSIKWIKMSVSCPIIKLLISSLCGVSTWLIFTFGCSSRSISAYFVTASFPALSPSKKKMISSNCFKGLIAFRISWFSPFVP